MFFKNNSVSVRIVKRLSLKRFYFGNYISWEWRRPLFAKAFRVTGRMNPHIVILGESGGGKSNAARLLVREFHKGGFNLIILDPNRDYLGIADSINADVYDASRSSINLFDLDDSSEPEKIGELMAILTRRLRLGHVQASVLKRCIGYCYWVMKKAGKVPTIKSLLYTIRIFQKRTPGPEHRTLETLHERLSLLDTGHPSRQIEMEKVISGSCVFLLSSLHSEEAQSIYMEGLLRKMYSMMLSGRIAKPTYIVIDEARKVSESRALGRIAAEGRKYGVGLITISQRANEIDGEVMGNSSLIVSFYQREPGELNYISNYIAGGNELGRFAQVKKGIRNLSVGEAIMLDSSQKEPFIARFPLCKTMPTSLRYFILDSSSKGMLQSELLRKLNAFGFRAEDSASEISRLVAERRLFGYEVSEGSFRGSWLISEPRNSAEHDLYVNLISRKLTSSGIRNEVYNSSYGPDIIAYSNGSSVAVEYETGRKKPEETSEMLLARKKKYEKVVVIVNDAHYGKQGAAEGITFVRLSHFMEQAKVEL
ncbi:MAG TPA: ATP-binding protein [Candidatus Saccharimonadales bacterium]|nr:ATP-binding protein [Candidatus Saccharimonadales bacterium]